MKGPRLLRHALAWLSRPGAASADEPAPGAGLEGPPPHPAALPYVHSGAISVLAVSGDGSTLAIGGAGPVNRERRRHQIYKEHFDVVIESDLVLVEDPAQLHDPAAAGGLRAISGHTGPIQEVFWEGATVWTAGADRSVRQSDVATGGTLAEALLHNDAIVALHPALLPVRSAETAPADAPPAPAPAAAPASAPVPHAHAHDHEHPETPAGDDGGDDDWHTPACDMPAPSAPPAILAFGATISSDRTLRIWTRHDRRVVTRQFLSPAIVLDGLIRADGAGPGRPVFLATDQLFRIVARVGVPDPEPLEPLKDTEPFYRLEPAGEGLAWAGHRLGDVVRVGLDDGLSRLVALERLSVFSGCRVPALHEFGRGGERWLAAGSLRGEVALVRLRDGLIAHCPTPLLGRVRALAWWRERLLAADHKGTLYDLTRWCDEVTGGA